MHAYLIHTFIHVLLISVYFILGCAESKGAGEHIEHITEHVSFSASGCLLQPFTIFENCFHSGPYDRSGPNNTLYGISPKGYMDSKLFKKWIEK